MWMGAILKDAKKTLDLEVRETKGYGKTSAFFSDWNFAGKKVGFDSSHTTFDSYLEMKKLGSDLVALESMMQSVRAQKMSDELELLRRAAHLGTRGCQFLLEQLQPGIREKDLVKALEIFWLGEGGDRLAFSPHIAFGPATSEPHYRPSHRTLAKGDLVMIDIGVVLDDYHSDMTRVYSFGDPDPQMAEIYEIVYQAQQKALIEIRSGVDIAYIETVARDFIEKSGYGDFFPHSLGHGIGLEIHEQPFLRPKAEGVLQENMVITVEPGIYIPNVGGVRLEDTVVVTENGHENLTKLPISSFLPQI